jgi:L-ascorbate metabolism protein UlaG (beta-lactamase superfamily)
MTITWHGYACVKIQESSKDGEVTVIVDPFTPAAGEKLPKNLAADLLITTADDPAHANLAAVGGESFHIDSPGEYEVKDILVHAVGVRQGEGKAASEARVVTLGVGDVRVVCLGGVTAPLDEKAIEEIGIVDVLVVPCGGGAGLSATDAAAMLQKLEPRVVIPVNYSADGLGKDLAPLDAFLKAAGMARTEALPKIKLSKKDLPQEDTRLMLLDPQ